MSIRTRFAPSPTGSLHIGGARTAIFNWLFARHFGGKFILRIEDTDRTRSTEESIKEIIDAMSWLGLNWDEGPYRQSERIATYQNYAQKLIESGKAYKCYCTPEEIESRRKEAQKQGRIYRYEGTCRRLRSQPEDKPYAIRLMTPDEGSIEVEDLKRGTIIFDAKEIDDFIIQKTDGFPTYNFAVVVDDAEMEISHIIRGEDHLANTPKQVLIYRAFSFHVPKIAHVSTILGSDKTKLSKRHGATSVIAYKESGYLPEALINYLARLGWSYGDQEIFSKDDLIDKFTLENIGKSPAVFNPEKLIWLNGWYIRNKPLTEIAELVIPLLKDKGIQVKLDNKLIKIVENLRERAKTLLDIVNSADYFFTDEIKFDDKAKNRFLTAESLPIFEKLINKLSRLDKFSIEELEGIFQEIIDESGLKLVNVAQPTRVALTGGTVSPGIFEVMEILGKDIVIERLKKAVANISST
ncbi:MAG: glutamate--tRNA ligase [Deltaproteobacteria bacterium]|nr:glutamate--tRNA ligase [Deltaproteobacteria bacterium]